MYGMHVTIPPLLLLLAACASPAPDMVGAARYDITLDGIDFAVFHRGKEAEVIRMGYLSMPDRDRVPALMIRAAQETTGCRAISDSVRTRLPGDTGEARVALDC